MALLLLQRADLRKRLCALLEPDYTCFSGLGYDVRRCYSGASLFAFVQKPAMSITR